MNLDDFVSRLDPKIAKGIQIASKVKLERLPLASRRLTQAIGGGIGKGRTTAIYGNFSAGKTMLALQSIGMWQKMGLVCAFVDVEGTYEPEFAKKLGVNNDELIIISSKSSNKISDSIAPLLRAEIDVIVIDSISAIVPAVFTDERTGDLVDADRRKQIGAHAKAIKTVISCIDYENISTAVVLLSQTTTKIEQTYVKQVPHGGNALGFSSSTMIKLTSSNTDAQQKKGLVDFGDYKMELPIGRTVSAHVEKNKIGRQSSLVEYDIYYAGDVIGIDSMGELVDMCIERNIIAKSGSWFSYGTQGSEDFFQKQGKDALNKHLLENPELIEMLEAKLNA